LKTPEAFRKALSTDVGGLDRAFDEYLKGKTAGYIEAVKNSDAMKATKEALIAMCNSRPSDFFANFKLGTIYKTDGDSEKAIAHFKRAIESYPFYTGQGNPYTELAALYESKGLKQEAAAQFAALARIDEDAHEALKRLAQLRIELGDKAGAVEALKAGFYIYPLDASLHQIAGGVYLEQGAAPEAAREYQIVLALGPTDPANAHYDLARALLADGKKADARRQVLRALEIAPGFEKAQELLLKLKGGAP
jgi:tetratricopeptide (TPR) repeat protein